MIEDDLVDQMAFKRSVKEYFLNYDVTIADSVEAANDIISSEEFDIIVSDYNLGDGTAFEVLENVHDTPFIVITGAGDEELAISAIKLGASDYIVKDQQRKYLKILPVTIGSVVKNKQNENEKRQVQEELRQNKERLDLILHSIGVGVVVIDSKMNIILINNTAYELLGDNLDRKSLISLQDVLQNCKDNGRSLLDSLDKQNFAKLQLEIEFPLPKILSVTGTSFMEKDGKSGGKVFIFNDVTKEKEVDRMKTDFVSSVSHELRTPLTSILGFSSTILRKKDMPEEMKYEFLEIIQKESKRLSRLIEDVLSISRIESGRVSFEFEDTSLGEVVADVFDIYHVQAEKKGLDISCKCADGLPLMSGDKDSLHQVVVNFVGNAVKFTPEGGSVSISLSQVKDLLELKIEDTGLGIPEKDQARIFEKFYRVSRPGTHIQGTGLGLSIVKEIIDAHGGSIKIQSTVGKGTTFRIYFPIKDRRNND